MKNFSSAKSQIEQFTDDHDWKIYVYVSTMRKWKIFDSLQDLSIVSNDFIEYLTESCCKMLGLILKYNLSDDSRVDINIIVKYLQDTRDRCKELHYCIIKEQSNEYRTGSDLIVLKSNILNHKNRILRNIEKMRRRLKNI